MEYYLIITRMAFIKGQQLTNNGEDPNRRGLSNNSVEIYNDPNYRHKTIICSIIWNLYKGEVIHLSERHRHLNCIATLFKTIQ